MDEPYHPPNHQTDARNNGQRPQKAEFFADNCQDEVGMRGLEIIPLFSRCTRAEARKPTRAKRPQRVVNLFGGRKVTRGTIPRKNCKNSLHARWVLKNQEDSDGNYGKTNNCKPLARKTRDPDRTKCTSSHDHCGAHVLTEHDVDKSTKNWESYRDCHLSPVSSTSPFPRQ